MLLLLNGSAKKQSQETVVLRLLSIQRKFSIKNASQRSGHPDLYSSSKSSEKYLMARTVQNQGGGGSGGELEGYVNLRIAGFFASLPFLTNLCNKRLKPSIHWVQL